jgi:hypothetical protein
MYLVYGLQFRDDAWLGVQSLGLRFKNVGLGFRVQGF